MADKRWSIYCRVVDNYGDIGVCWRLARQLHAETDQTVTLWVDDLGSFMRLHPAVTLASSQIIEGVTVRHWAATIQPEMADVVIEAFACELPHSVITAMRQQEPAPLWLNLEYLSAEDWVGGCHGLPSPQEGGLEKYFFFPGFAAGTGGVPGEAGLLARRQAWTKADCRAWLNGHGVANPDALTISLFAYENAALTRLLAQWQASPQPLNILVPEGRVLASLASALGLAELTAGQIVQTGAATIYIVPMLPQADYDAMLWSCDLNFVRGEDSFVRAQWAALPMVWHIYPQAEDAHLLKLEAFLALYLQAAPPAAATALRDFWQGWNRGELVINAWQNLLAERDALQAHALFWAAHLEALGNLSANLARFVNARLK